MNNCTSSSSKDVALPIEQFHTEAVDCLKTFPGKIVELNNLVSEYAPKLQGVKNVNGIKCSKWQCQQFLSAVDDHDHVKATAESTWKNNNSRVLFDRGRGIRKRRYYRRRGIGGYERRRRPGPLKHILTSFIKQLAFCTKKIVIEPSRFMVGNVMPSFYQRASLNEDDVPSSEIEPESSTSSVSKESIDNSMVKRLTEAIRLKTIELISDTTTVRTAYCVYRVFDLYCLKVKELKRWLQSLVEASSDSLPVKLANASRITESIDCWAYELFFHLKYLQMNCVSRTTNKVSEETSNPKDDEATYMNLWRRIVDLRNKYITLYETLSNLENVQSSQMKKSEEV